MKKKITLVVFALLAICTLKVNAQWTAGADVVSSYIWRGSKAGAFSIQPTIKYTDGGFSIGAWGSGDLATGAPQEADLFASYSFKSGLSLGVTDYHYNVDTLSLFGKNVHAFEANVGYAVGKFSISGNYIFNSASGAAGNDKYFEAGYQFASAKLFVGAGDGWYTKDGTFQVCNIGISTTKTIKVTDSFSIPFTGSVIFNPNKEQIFYVVAMSF
jgi:hypothetical protein